MNNVLVTGGAGFIGSHLAKKLIHLGFNVTVLDNLSSQIHGDNPEKNSSTFKSALNAGVRFIKGTITDKTTLLEALAGQDAVIHLAAETGTGQSMYEIQKYVDINIGGTASLLDILTNTRHTIKKILVASSRAIYGEGKYNCIYHGNVYPSARIDAAMKRREYECVCPLCGGPLQLEPTDEESKIHPTSVYGITKRTQEGMVLMVGKSLGIPAVALRYQNVYGPGQSLSNPYTGILSIFSTQIKNNSSINIFEDGKESRDFVYIDDVVRATISGLTNEQANFEVFNVGSGDPISVLTVAKLLKKNYSSDIQINVSGNYRLGDIRHNYADLSKIKRKLGYTPIFSFEHGLRAFCQWVENQEIHEDRYLVSINEMKLKGLYR